MEPFDKIYFGLFILFLGLYLVNQSFIKNMHQTILGRILLFMIVIFFSMNSITLGLLVGLIIMISSSNYSYSEGFENTKPDEKTPLTSVKEEKQEKKEHPPHLQQTNIPEGGVDIQSMKEIIQPKPSSTLPPPPPQNTDSVVPSAKETFTSMYSVF